MNKILALMIGGALGTLLRYWVSDYAIKLFDSIFPWGTFIVNLVGSLLIGICWGFFEKGQLNINTRLFLFVGLFGGFTTFSSFSLESLNLLKTGHAGTAILYMLSSNILGLLFVYLGYIFGRSLSVYNR